MKVQSANFFFFRFSNPEFRMSAEEAKNLRPACPTAVKGQGIIPFNYNLIFRLNRFKNIYLKVFLHSKQQHQSYF